MSKEAYYFSHDSNARHDPKITAMRGVYGSEGYAWFFMFIEMMRETDGYKLDMQSKYAFNAYAMQMHSNSDAIASFVHDCVNEFDLFSSDGDTFWSESLLRRMDKAHERSKKAAESANARWKKTQKDANALKEHAIASESDAIKESKVKEIKIKEIKTLYAPNVKLTELEYQRLTTEYGKELTDLSIEYLSSYKIEKDYKTKDDNRTIRRWVLEATKKTMNVLPFKQQVKTEKIEREVDLYIRPSS